MTKFQRIAAWLMLLACAAAQAQTDTATAERLMRQSGLWEQVGAVAQSFPDALMAGVAQAPKPPSESEKTRLLQRVSQAFSAERLRASAMDVVSKHMQPRHTRPILDWYESNSGRTIRQSEIDATAEQAKMPPEDLIRLGGALWAQLPPARRRLLDELIKATQAEDAMLQITQNSMLAMQRGLALAAPDQPMPSESQVRKEIRAQQTAMRQAFNEMIRTSMAMTYHDLSDRALRDYLAFCKSPAGRHFNQVGIHALDQALSTALQDMMQSLPGTRDNQNI